LPHKYVRVENASLVKGEHEEDHSDNFDRTPVSLLDNRFRPPHALCRELRDRMGSWIGKHGRES
jgi:hypothetical protein